MTTLTVAEFATAIDTDARTARKFLRSITPKDAQPGKGSRWTIEAKQVRSLKSQFTKFEKAASDAKLAKVTAPQVDENDGPTDADLAEIDAE